jgi:NAD(P)-dependent dehydrogenase (short-subunit alcohol dehydrogenase family)
MLQKGSDRLNLDFSGKVVFVSGGSRGIGRGIAEAFAGQGAEAVVLTSRNAGEVEAAAREIADSTGTDCFGLVMDVTDEKSVAQGFELVGRKYRRLDVAVNNAGVANSVSFGELDAVAWDRIINTNLKGVYSCCRHEVPLMEARGGAVVNIASISGSMVNVPQFQANYNTSKAGVIMLTRSLAVEYAQRGIRFNSVSPGYTLTDMNRRPEVQEMIEIWRRRIPMNRLAEVSEIAGPVLFLASDLGSYVTGHDLVVDGGITVVC